MLVNEIKIAGRAYRYTARKTKNDKTVCEFGLQYWNGKDQEGKSKYAFISCRGFEDFNLKDKQEIVVFGKIRSDEWVNKEGKQESKDKIYVDRVEPQESKQQQEKPKQDEFINDSIPF